MLLLVHRIPFPPNKGDKVRSYHLLRHLARHYRVHIGAFIDDPDDWQYVEQVKALCGEFHFETLDPRLMRLKSAVGFLNGMPLTLPYYFNHAMQRWVDEVIDRHSIQRVLIFSSAMAQYVDDREDMVRVADFVDIDSDKWRQYAGTKSFPMNWVYRREADALLDFERDIASRFDATVFVSSIEARHFQEMAPECAERVGYVNNGVDSHYFDPALVSVNPYAADILPIVFTGAMDYWPNIDAVQWFATGMVPAIRAQAPSAMFYIVGARPTEAVLQLGQLPGVVVTGSVADIRPYIAHARVAVAPLRLARGVQNKVLEAMAMARPVIASPQAAEGIEALAGRDLLVADGVDDFVAKVLAGLKGAHDGLGQAGRACVLAAYSWEHNLATFEHLLDGVPDNISVDAAQVRSIILSGSAAE